MILSNNPSIDVEDLMRRVRAEAARLRAGGEVERGRIERANTPSERLNDIIDRRNSIEAYLVEADLRNQPRTQVPARFARLRGLGRQPIQFMLRVVNYLFKPQREVSAAQNEAIREMSALLAAAAQDLNDLNRRVAALTERLEQRESTIDSP